MLVLLKETASGLAYGLYSSNGASRPASFVHLVSHEEADGSNALTALAAFKAFSAGVKERCVTPPARVELTEIGSYGFFGG